MPVVWTTTFNLALSFWLAGAFIYVVIYTIWLKPPPPPVNIVIGGAAGGAGAGQRSRRGHVEPARRSLIVLALLVFALDADPFLEPGHRVPQRLCQGAASPCCRW